jgi:hypothetical protein
MILNCGENRLCREIEYRNLNARNVDENHYVIKVVLNMVLLQSSELFIVQYEVQPRFFTSTCVVSCTGWWNTALKPSRFPFISSNTPIC